MLAEVTYFIKKSLILKYYMLAKVTYFIKKITNFKVGRVALFYHFFQFFNV